MSISKKIVLLGHFGVGKTSLVRRYVDSAFGEDYLVTVGVHVKKKEIEINNEKITLIIWDIEGNTTVSKARKSYLLGTHGFLYVFDVTRPETYQNLTVEIDFLNKEYPSIPQCILGNKNDLISSEKIKIFFKNDLFKNCLFTSAKTGENVESAFLQIGASMIE